MAITTPRQQALDMLSQQCAALIPELHTALTQATYPNAPLVSYQQWSPLDFDNGLAIRRYEIEQLPGFQQLRTYCDAQEISLDLEESVPQGHPHGPTVWDLLSPSTSFGASPTAFSLRIRWGQEPDEALCPEEALCVAKEFFVVHEDPWDGGGFPLLDDDNTVIQSAICYLTTMLQRCALTPEVCDLLHQVQTALTHLAECTPEIAIECTLTLRRRSQDYVSRRSWGIILNDEEFRLYADGDAEGNFTFVMLPQVDIVLASDGRHSFDGHAQEWFWMVDEVLTVSSAALKRPGMTTTLELLVDNIHTGTATTISLWPPPPPQ